MSDNHSYDVHFIEDGDLPGDAPWAFVCTGTRLMNSSKREDVGPRTLTDAWAAYREIVARGVMAVA